MHKHPYDQSYDDDAARMSLLAERYKTVLDMFVNRMHTLISKSDDRQSKGATDET